MSAHQSMGCDMSASTVERLPMVYITIMIHIIYMVINIITVTVAWSRRSTSAVTPPHDGRVLW
jgi:hypothetical protein